MLIGPPGAPGYPSNAKRNDSTAVILRLMPPLASEFVAGRERGGGLRPRLKSRPASTLCEHAQRGKLHLTAPAAYAGTAAGRRARLCPAPPARRRARLGPAPPPAYARTNAGGAPPGGPHSRIPPASTHPTLRTQRQ